MLLSDPSKASNSSKSHRFYNVFWTSSFCSTLAVSGDPKTASRTIFTASLKRYRNKGLDSNSTSWDAFQGTNMSILPRTCAKSRLPCTEPRTNMSILPRTCAKSRLQRFLAPYGGGDFLHTSLVILTFWSRGGVSRGRIWVQTSIFIACERRRQNRSRGGFRVAGNGQIAAKTRCSKNGIKPVLFWWLWCFWGAKRCQI